MYRKDRAIVLFKRSADDASNFYILYTQRNGLQKVKVRGAKKSLSKMAGHLEPPALGEVFVALGRKMNYIAGANLIKRFDLNSLEKHKIQFWLVKLIMRLIRENSGDAKIWILLNDFYNQLENTNNNQHLLILKNIFLWQFGAILGFMTDFNKFCECSRENVCYLNYKNGEILCKSCYSKNSIFISEQILNFLRAINNRGLNEVFSEFKNFKALVEFDKISKRFWQYRFEVKL